MRVQVEHATVTAELAETADLALDQIVATLGNIERMAEQIAQTTSQQSGAGSEIRSHSVHLHEQGDSNPVNIRRGRQQSEQMLRLANELNQATQTFRV